MKTQIAIIGAGTAGLSAYRQARKRTDSVLLIEGGPGGTTCARAGCMPSKLLIAAADAAHAVREANVFGVRTEPPRIDGAAVMRRVREERDRFVRLTLEDIEAFPARHRISAHARFVDDHRLRLDDGRELEAERIIIATGSSPSIPEPWRVLGDRLVANEQVFEWRSLPESVAVVGTGVIGLELGQALHRLGVRVRLFDKGRSVGLLKDQAVIDYALRLFEDEMLWSAESELETPQRDGDQVLLRWTQGGQSHQERFDYLLAATGRRPNVWQLGLENTGLKLDKHGVPEFDRQTLRCSLDHIFIAGDADGELPLLHEAADDGRFAGLNAGRYPDVRRYPRRAALQILFSDPQIAIVGAGSAVLEAAGRPYREASLSFENQGRSRVINRNRGFAKLYGCPHSGRFLGAELIAPNAEHLAHLLAWSVQQKLKVSTMLDMPFYHPVIEEGLRSGLRSLLRNMQMGEEPVPGCMDCGPGG